MNIFLKSFLCLNRVFNVYTVKAAIICLFLSILKVGAESSKKTTPNFLFVYTDDQRWDAMGFVQRAQADKARFPWVQTPNMDKLRAEGVWLSNMFCTTSLCSPSRASFLTGQYVHTHGVPNNHTTFPSDSVTYATLLKKAGYSTGFVGKWHMGDQADRPGFDYYASYRGQGKYFDCPFIVKDQGPAQTIVSKKWVDDAATDYAIEFMRRNKDNPFVLTVAFKSVHRPCEPDKGEDNLYHGESLRPVASSEQIAPYKKSTSSEEKNRGKTAGKKLDGNRVLSYFRCLSGADRNLGRLLDTLDELKLKENTVVIFTSDNGYFIGEHGLGDKRAAYEEGMRIPMIVRAPNISKAGTTSDSLCLNIDIAPTMLDYAGISIPKEMQGRSLRPLLEREAPKDWRTSFLYEYFFETRYHTPTIVAVRTETAKLVTYPGHPEWDELFDLRNDALEIDNGLSHSTPPEYLKKMQEELNRLKEETRYKLPENVDTDTFGKQPLKFEAHKAETTTPPPAND